MTEMAKNIDDLRYAQVALTPHTIILDKKSKSNLSLKVFPDDNKRGKSVLLKRSNFGVFFYFLILVMNQKFNLFKVTRTQYALKACEDIMIKEMDAEKVADVLYKKGTIVNFSTIQEIKVLVWSNTLTCVLSSGIKKNYELLIMNIRCIIFCTSYFC